MGEEYPQTLRNSIVKYYLCLNLIWSLVGSNEKDENCPIVFSMLHPGKVSRGAVEASGVQNQAACEAMCRDDPTCFAYQINNLRDSRIFGFQKSQESLNELEDSPTAAEFVKQRRCSTTPPPYTGIFLTELTLTSTEPPTIDTGVIDTESEFEAKEATTEATKESNLKSILIFSAIGVVVVCALGVAYYQLRYKKAMAALKQKGQGEKGQLIDKKSAKEPTQTKEKQQKSTAAVPAAKQNKFQDKKCNTCDDEKSSLKN